jgi:hypothetical protein
MMATKSLPRWKRWPTLIGDPTDRLAARVARDGEPEPVHIEETGVAFAIDWKGHYRIEGAAFIFVDRNTRQTRTILGYPTHQLEQSGKAEISNIFG